MLTASAIAHPNIALVKYWGKRDLALNLPAVPSLSLTLAPWRTHTTVTWGASEDRVRLNGTAASEAASERVRRFLDLVAPARPPVEVVSQNDFPTGAGLASSSSAFAALALAATTAAGQPLDPQALSALARRGSGSACRSLFGGFVRWDLGSADDGSDSVAHPVAGPAHWDLRMVVAIVDGQPKAVGSTEGMERSRQTSPLYSGWVERAQDRVDRAQQAVLDRDLGALGPIIEASTFEMHACMHTSRPPLIYWQDGTVRALNAVFELRRRGVGAWATMDAGPQVKVLCEAADAAATAEALRQVADRVEVLGPGQGARLVEATACE